MNVTIEARVLVFGRIKCYIVLCNLSTVYIFCEKCNVYSLIKIPLNIKWIVDKYSLAKNTILNCYLKTTKKQINDKMIIELFY